MLNIHPVLKMALSLVLITSNACQTEQDKKSFVVIDKSGEIKKKASNAGLEVSGDTVIEITGPSEDVKAVLAENSARYVENETLTIIAQDAATVEQEPVYMAKRDFALDSFLRAHPEADGRGVIVGVIDDGISANQTGFQKTTTGERKIIRRESNSSQFLIKLEDKDKSGLFVAELTEAAGVNDDRFQDLNLNGVSDSYSVTVNPKSSEVCIRLEKNSQYQCLHSFSDSGEYLYWNEQRTKLLTVEYDSQKQQVKFFQGEASARDAHGEGVASVMAGHRIGNKFDGVAPGAKILDYDLSEVSFHDKDNEYTIMTFVKALTWMGENGADVVNISYSIFFQSPESQLFMQKILSELVKKYQFIITFSAGNDGAALGSMSRGLIYPEDSLVVGAYASYDLEEYVHGVTGLDEEGAVIRYSSRGPSADGGTSPSVISPMASLVHHSSGEGFRGFSGTSSAAPAMGGFVASLLSHIKQKDIKYDHSALIAAVKMSATPLKNAGYVEQGFGLPKAEKAIEIYESIVSSKSFKKAQIELESTTTASSAGRGLFLEYDDLRDNPREYLLKMTGKVSELLSKDVTQNMLSEVYLKSNVDWIKGPRQTHLSIATSKAYLLVSAPESMAVGSYIFGEVTVCDVTTGYPLAKLPVTLVRSFKANKKKPIFKWNPTIASDSAERAFVDVSSETIGLKISYDHGENVSSSYIELYDPQGNAIHKAMSEREIYVETKLKGRYQVVMNRRGGTALTYKPEVKVEAVSMKTLNPDILAEDGHIQLKNGLKTGLYQLALFKKIEPISVKYKKTRVNQEAEFKFEDLEVGKHKFRWSLRRNSLVSRANYRCRSELMSKDGRILKTYRGGSGLVIVRVKKDYGTTDLRMRCYNFERTDLKDSEVYSVWKMERLSNEIAYKPIATKTLKIMGHGLLNDVSFGSLDTDATNLVLKVKSPNDDSPGITIQELSVLK